MKKICFITTSRADFGMVKVIINEALNFKKKCKIFLIVSGNHSDNFFGKSISEIKFNKNLKIIKILSNQRNNNSQKVALSFSNFMKKFSLTFKKLNPNIFVSFGDRYEMLAATISAFIMRIPIAHIAGGEKTSGSLDDGYRHSITKLSHLHFATSKEYKKRIIQLGENPSSVFNYGSLNRQKISTNNFFSKIEIEKRFNIKFCEKNILMTLHPENVNKIENLKNLRLVLECLNTLKDTGIFITSPNADEGGVEMTKFIKKYISNKKKFKFIKSFGTRGYLSILRIIDGVIGNSSSGISEVPLFSINSINLGNRQKGREMPFTVTSCRFEKKIIIKNLKKLIKKSNHIRIIKKDKLVAKKIFNKILTFNFEKNRNKNFKDLKFNL